MPTGRELISDIRSMNRLLSGDNTITDRAIFNLLKSTSSTLIKRETNQRKLWNSPNIFTKLGCLEMKQVPLSECCDYQSSCKVARSVKKIPQISEGIFGLLVQSVYSPGMSPFNFTTIERYINALKLQLRNTRKFYWVHDGYLYISDSELESVNMLAYFDVDFNPADYSMCQEDNDESCINPLDKQFKIPSYLEKTLKDMVNDSLNQIYFRHREDPTPDGNDTSQ